MPQTKTPTYKTENVAKRFTDTNKYKKPFIRSLKGAYKLLWDFLYHDCDHAGIWIVDFEIAQTYVGSDMPINKVDALQVFNDDETRIIEIDGGKKWFIPSFIEFQYGVLSEKNRAHTNVISILKRHNLLNTDLSIKKIKPLTSPLQGAKEMEKEKEKEKDEGGMGETIPQGVVPEMLQLFMAQNHEYPTEQDTDFPALREIGDKIVDWMKLPGDLAHPKNLQAIRLRWGEIVTHIKAHSHFQTYSISQVNKHFQSIAQSFNNRNGKQNGTTNKQPGTQSGHSGL